MHNMENGLILDTIKNDLSSIDYKGETVKYNVSYHLLHAADYGVPQIRKRVFIVGIRSDLDISYEPPAATHIDKWVTAKEAIDDLWGYEDDPSILNHSQVSRAKFYPGRRLQGNMRIKSDQPSITIRAEHHGNIEAHYKALDPNKSEEDMKYWRRLTVRECARLQTFPDTFKFKGAATHTYKQIGNAVPPVLGWHVAKSIQNVLQKSNELIKSL